MYVIRTSNLQSLHSSGRLPTQDRLEGLREDLANNVDYLELHRDDVLVMFGGGGGGLGDPLLREVGLVVADVRDSYLTAEHAAAAYGVVLSESGELDEKATAEQRQSILAARIGGTPSKPLQAPKDIGVSVVHLDSAWHCGSCNEKLAPAQSNWRGGAVVREVGIVERFAELRMEVRARSEDPSVVVRESYCPSCAHCLGVDVLAAGSESPGAPKLSTAGSERE
jgi:N-methylhydantoinase B